MKCTFSPRKLCLIKDIHDSEQKRYLILIRRQRMTNKEAIAILENQKIQGKTFYSQRLALDLAIKALEQSEWIPVGERLPKYNKTVLISVKQKGKEANVFTAQRRKRFKTPDIFECCMDNDGWWDFRISAWDDHEVIAWMPLPKPYKEVNND
jgi:hypothetical protein